MQFLRFKKTLIGWLMLYFSIGYLSIAFSPDIIHPFMFAQDADIEKYNYVAGIISNVKPIILLYIIYLCISFLDNINIHNRHHYLVKKGKRDMVIVVVGLLAYQFKELFDYLAFENVIPNGFSALWFLILWELLPVAGIMVWIILTAKSRVK